MCVANVLPAHIVAGMAGKNEPETEVQLEIIVGSNLTKPDSHLLLVRLKVWLCETRLGLPSRTALVSIPHFLEKGRLAPKDGSSEMMPWILYP